MIDTSLRLQALLRFTMGFHALPIEPGRIATPRPPTAHFCAGLAAVTSVPTYIIHNELQVARWHSLLCSRCFSSDMLSLLPNLPPAAAGHSLALNLARLCFQLGCSCFGIDAHRILANSSPLVEPQACRLPQSGCSMHALCNDMRN